MKSALFEIGHLIKISPDIIKGHTKTVAKISNQYGGNRLALFIDMIASRIFLGANTSDYLEHKFWGKKWREKKRFITEFKRRKLMNMFDDKNLLENIENKHLFNKMYAPFIHRDCISTDVSSEIEIRNFIQKHRKVMVKPSSSGRGVGISIVHNDNEKEIIDFLQSTKDTIYTIEEIIVNCDELRKMNPSSLNTFRVITVVDKKGEVHILYATLRMGIGDSFVDNVCQGGVMCSVNLEHGVIDSIGITKSCDKHWYHPTSGVQFIGTQIPRWNEFKKYIVEVASFEKKLRYVGWDIAITPKEFELIEGNCRPDGDTFQVFDQEGKLPMLMSYY